METFRRKVAKQPPALAAADPSKAIPTTIAVFERIQTKTYGRNWRRPVLEGISRCGYELELHLTELGPGEEAHPPHRHEHEEIVMVQSGTIDVTIEGKTTRLTPGSVVYVASNQFHGWRNPTSSCSQYFIITFKHGPESFFQPITGLQHRTNAKKQG